VSFVWPELLWLLLLAPALVAAYLWLLRRRKKLVLRFASLALVREAMGRPSNWRRHLPPALLLLAIVALLVAAARPAAVVSLPSQHETVILAIDVSGSMRATDVAPDRIGAAQAAARAFIEDLPPQTRVGVVSFAATASVVQPPTRQHDQALAAIDRLQIQKGTAVGSAILVSLKAIVPDVEFDLYATNPRPKPAPGSRRADAEKGGDPARGADKAGKSADKGGAAPKAEPGSFASAAIILLTDGQSAVGPDPVESAKMAAERGVRVFTVGFGTTKGHVLSDEGWSMRVRLDEDTLKRGDYHEAASAGELRKVYDRLAAKLVFERREIELSAVFAAAGALLAVLATALSIVWFRRVG
jgi:Ca-activated chloride channel family protein